MKDLDKKIKNYQNFIIWSGVIGIWGMLMTGEFWFWLILSLTFEFVLIYKIKRLSKEYGMNIDWKHYWLGWGKEKIKEK